MYNSDIQRFIIFKSFGIRIVLNVPNKIKIIMRTLDSNQLTSKTISSKAYAWNKKRRFR